MTQDLFLYLPSEILIDILLSLSPEVILTCKCVCKAWLDLIESDVFHKSHPLALVVSTRPRIQIGSVFSNWKTSASRIYTFSLPPNIASIQGKLCTLGDYLCFYDDEGYYNGAIWLLKEYEQADKCWIEVLKVTDFDVHCFYPIKVYENGDTMLWQRRRFLYYSNESGKVREIESFSEMSDSYQQMWCAGRYYINSICLTPSYLPLKRVFLGMENIFSF
ncbi:F-box protein-like protein isoform X1 [Salvia divinorum]|uniref:F-box protein-like protein isoform X1 n=1 Tax=Salvia divinorum TaxID=28513 RepID=A0ABD1HMJ5_SALDI